MSGLARSLSCCFNERAASDQFCHWFPIQDKMDHCSPEWCVWSPKGGKTEGKKVMGGKIITMMLHSL